MTAVYRDMARIAHLSDLHFGAHDDRLVAAVEERVDEAKPDLVVISGDFTQRARTEQFKEACQFLERLREAGHEVLGVPGNHDVPLYDVLRRFLSPLTRYRRFIDETLVPVSRAARRGGAWDQHRALADLQGRADQRRAGGVHPRDLSPGPRPTRRGSSSPIIRCSRFRSAMGRELGKAIGRQEMALEAIAEAGVDLLLAGHNHRASTHHARDLVTDAARRW